MKVIKTKRGTFTFEGKVYNVDVLYKSGKKNITYRFRNNAFIVSAPIFTNQFTISNGLKKFAPKLVKHEKRELPVGNDYVYILGNKVDKRSGAISLGDDIIRFSNDEELKKELKKILIKIVKEYSEYYAYLMKVAGGFKVSVKDMKTRYGSNSKRTNRLAYSLVLIHYDIEIIKAIVVHEVAHFVHFDHSKEFYKVVLKHCPAYHELHHKLVKGEYK